MVDMEDLMDMSDLVDLGNRVNMVDRANLVDMVDLVYVVDMVDMVDLVAGLAGSGVIDFDGDLHMHGNAAVDYCQHTQCFMINAL